MTNCVQSEWRTWGHSVLKTRVVSADSIKSLPHPPARLPSNKQLVLWAMFTPWPRCSEDASLRRTSGLSAPCRPPPARPPPAAWNLCGDQLHGREIPLVYIFFFQQHSLKEIRLESVFTFWTIIFFYFCLLTFTLVVFRVYTLWDLW